jgi:hypothetical protein
MLMMLDDDIIQVLVLLNTSGVTLWNSTTYRYIKMLVFSVILLEGSRKTLQQYFCSVHVV